jgi:hypothetical protein
MRRTSSIRATYTTGSEPSFELMAAHPHTGRIPPTATTETDMSHIDPTIVIRAARGSDGPVLERLAELDSQRPLMGDVIVGEREGELIAALAPATGRAIADPFRPTADIVALLSLHGRRDKAPRRRLLPALPSLRAA